MKVAPVQPYIYGVSAPSGAAQPLSAPTGTKSTNNTEPATLTPAERELFIRLFPESASYIAHHVLFTREGRLHEPDIYKGTFVDIRV